MRFTKLCLAVFAASMLAACSTNSLNNERWTNFDNQTSAIRPQGDRAGLVFYRVDKGANPIAVNIRVNGEYLSSLQVGGFTKVDVCAKPVKVEASYVAANSATNLSINKLDKQSVHYFNVDVSNPSKPRLKEVDAETAQMALKMLRHQAHTISRVSHTACATN